MKKLIVFGGIALITLLFLRNMDLNFRYNLNFLEYHKYNSGLTSTEEERLKLKPLMIGIYESPPLAYVNTFNNHSTGIMVDYLSQLSTELRTNHLLKIRSESQIIKALNDQEIDAAVLEKNVLVEDEVDFTQTLCVLRGKILVRQNSDIQSISDLGESTIVVLQKDHNSERIAQTFTDHNKVNFLEVDNLYQAFALIGKGLAVGIVGDDLEILQFLSVTNRRNNYRFLNETLYEKEIALAVGKEDSDLLAILEKGILKLKKKNLIILTQYKWLGEFDANTIDMRQINITYKILSAIIGIVSVFSIWNYMISQKVTIKTKELSESREQLRLIIESLQRGIMVISHDNCIEECNEVLASIVGQRREKIIGTPYHRYKELNILINEFPFDQPFKVDKYYYYTTCMDLFNNKQLITIEDYTMKHVNELQARQESKMIAIGHLSAGLAHEIRNPLGLIKSYAYIIEKHLNSEHCQHAITVINDSVARINKLIENLLRYSKLSNEEYKEVHLESLLNLIISFIDQKILNKNISLIKNLMLDSDETIIINEDVLKMTMLNLINNSIDSFENTDREEKTITISLKVKDGYLHFSVIDNGCGMDSECLENIFNPFYSTKDTGTGLGLYIINTEITKNEGKISVQSALGNGTQIDVFLPIRR